MSKRNGAKRTIRRASESGRFVTEQPRKSKQTKTTGKEKTADELMLEAWKYTYENRHRRVTKP
jgi:hypothetical protein